MNRPSKPEYFLEMAHLVATRGTCGRRKVGCVLVDELGLVLSTGYNGPPRGLQHCTQYPCPGVNKAPGTELELCMAVHAEANALLQCANVDKIDVAYVTCSPCLFCVRLLLNTPCRQIVFREAYVHYGAEQIWTTTGRVWSRISKEYEPTHM